MKLGMKFENRHRAIKLYTYTYSDTLSSKLVLKVQYVVSILSNRYQVLIYLNGHRAVTARLILMKLGMLIVQGHGVYLIPKSRYLVSILCNRYQILGFLNTLTEQEPLD